MKRKDGGKRKDGEVWVERGPLSEKARGKTKRVDLPPGFGEKAKSREEFLTLLLEYLRSIGLEDADVDFTMPPRFRAKAPDHAGQVGAEMIGAAAVARAAETCTNCTGTRRGLLGKIAGVGVVAALLSAFGPFGQRNVRAACGDCGTCRICYCFQGDRYCDFYYCYRGDNSCYDYCTTSRRRCTLNCGCV